MEDLRKLLEIGVNLGRLRGNLGYRVQSIFHVSFGNQKNRRDMISRRFGLKQLDQEWITV
jgi:hypothetical protein